MSHRYRAIASLLATVFVLALFMQFYATRTEAASISRSSMVQINTVALADPVPRGATLDTIPIVATSAAITMPVINTITKNQRYITPVVESDSHNFLLVGSDPSAWNFDTMLILSISPSRKTTTLINIPRDIHVDYSDWVIQSASTVTPGIWEDAGIYRINAAHAIGYKIAYNKGVGRFDKPYMDFLCDLLEEVFSIHIKDYAYVRVDGFRRIVDYFGGVTINVPQDMKYEDPTQNLKIDLKKGLQRLNGTQAEGFVRFRQGYDAEGILHNQGDLYRKDNQVKFVKAFLTQNLTLKNFSRIGAITDFLQSNMLTSLKDRNHILDCAGIAEISLREKYEVRQLKLDCTETRINGASYLMLPTASPSPSPSMPHSIDTEIHAPDISPNLSSESVVKHY